MKLVLILTLVSSLIIVYHLTHRDQDVPEPPKPTPDEKVDLKSQFVSFVANFARNYKNSKEFDYRFGVFKKNLEKIEAIRKSGVSHSVAVNEFGDWTDEEFETMLGMKGRAKAVRSEQTIQQNDKDPIPEATFFWSNLGNKKGVHPVKNQMSCGSCWAFSAIAAYENAYWQWTDGDMETFSEQQLVDCSFSYYNDGCRGGELSYAYQYLTNYNAILDANYPYKARDQSCAYFTSYYRPGPKVFKYVEQNNTNDVSMKNMVH
jgi:hypothetical protein